MVRTQIQLDEARYAELRRFAQACERSMADCIREAIGLLLQRASTRGDELAKVAGKFSPVPEDDLKDHDRWWTESMAPSDGSPT